MAALAPTPKDYRALFTGHGETDLEYLDRHCGRFLQTFRLFSGNWSPEQGDRVLDIGAHWLHQSVLYATAGYRVAAADFASTFEHPGLRSLAQAHGISLYAHGEFGQSDAFAGLPDDSMDVVLFCEVLEHLAFNPIAFWQSVYRVLAPNGRIVVTTPNYYFWKTRLRSAWRFATFGGGGVPVEQVVKRPTYAHHWKEYAPREVRRYFSMLSPDFRLHRLFCMSDRWTHVGVLGRSIYAEVDLPVKRQGIVVETTWS